MKHVIITGANGNIGYHLANRLLDNRHSLYLFYHEKSDRIERLADHPLVETIQVDLTDTTTIDKHIKRLFQRVHPDVLIHTAAVRSFDFKPLCESSPEIWEKVITTNILSTYSILRACIPFLRNAKPGRVIIFGSDVSRMGLKNGSAYAASKAALANICRTVAKEEPDVYINTLSPGPIMIDDSHFDDDYRSFRQNYYAEPKKNIPLKRVAVPEDVIGLSLFLISDENSYISGEEFFITGGK
ncbi:MAG: SDR family oxidoreductase [Candidatus Cloacimonetes bacterium]|nr:SDR family oxidoreductase [Candidatus Cloacimonadota bacterium]